MKFLQKPRKTEIKVKSNFIDKFIGYFSPEREKKRLFYRNFDTKHMFSGYSGAATTRMRSNWLPGSGSADEDILYDLESVRDRSRDLIRNNSIARGIIDVIIENVISTGIKPQARIPDELGGETLNPIAEELWRKFENNCDATGQLNIYDFQRLALRQILENGDVCIINTRLNTEESPFLLRLEMVEADRLETPAGKISDNSIRGGVLIGNRRGQIKGYYIKRTHPGDIRASGSIQDDYNFIPIRNSLGNKNVFHLFRQERAGQHRGVPILAPAMLTLEDLGKYFEAELVANRIMACQSLFITTANPWQAATNRVADTDANNNPMENIEPGMIRYMAPGESISSFTPTRPGQMFEPYVERMLRTIASSVNMPYEVIAKDYSRTNFSSVRAALLDARRYWRGWQQFLIKNFLNDVWALVLEEAYLNDMFPARDFDGNKDKYTQVQWLAPAWEWVDPTNDIKAIIEALDANLTTHAEENAKMGKDWEETFVQRAKEKQFAKKLNIESTPNVIVEEDIKKTEDNTEDEEPGINNIRR